MRKYWLLLVVMLLTVFISQNVSANEVLSGTIKKNNNLTYTILIEEKSAVTIKTKETEHHLRYTLKYNNEFIDSWSEKEASIRKYGLPKGEYTLIIDGSYIEPEKMDFSVDVNISDERVDDYYLINGKRDAMTIQPHQVIHGLSQNVSNYRDYYKIVLQEDGYVQGTIKNVEQANLSLVDEAGHIIAIAHEGVLTQNVRKGTYYFATSNENYTFSYNVTAVDFVKNEELEPNQTVETANMIFEGKAFKGHSNSGDTDMLKFEMPVNGFANFNISEGINYKVYSMDGQIVYENRYGDRKQFSVALLEGTYVIELDLTYYAPTYTISYTVDPYEHPVVINKPNQGIVNVTLDTWMKYKAYNHSESITFELNDLESGFYELNYVSDGKMSASFSLIDQPFTTYIGKINSQQIISKIGLSSNKYTVNLSMSGATNNEYKFKLSKVADFAEVEPNDKKEAANLIPINETIHGTIETDEYDYDFYQFTLDEPTFIQYNLQASSDVSFFVTNEKQTQKIYFKNGDKRMMAKGTYYIQIFAANSDGVEYAFELANADVKAFTDVPKKHAYFYEITHMRNLGIITGYGNNTFKPNAPMQRQHVAAMIVRANAPGLANPTQNYPAFKDVPKKHANYDAIMQLVNNEIVVANKNFNPTGTITRAQMAKILVSAFDIPYKYQKPAIQFKDVKHSNWFADDVQILAHYGITTGSNGYFKPNEPLTRQHFATFLTRTLDVLENK